MEHYCHHLPLNQLLLTIHLHPRAASLVPQQLPVPLALHPLVASLLPQQLPVPLPLHPRAASLVPLPVSLHLQYVSNDLPKVRHLNRKQLLPKNLLLLSLKYLVALLPGFAVAVLSGSPVADPPGSPYSGLGPILLPIDRLLEVANQPPVLHPENCWLMCLLFFSVHCLSLVDDHEQR